MLDFILAHPFGSVIFLGSISSFVYASWKDGKIEKREQTLENEMRKREQTLENEMSKREQTLKNEMRKREESVRNMLHKFQIQTGVDVETLMQIAKSDTEFDNMIRLFVLGLLKRRVWFVILLLKRLNVKLLRSLTATLLMSRSGQSAFAFAQWDTTLLKFAIQRKVLVTGESSRLKRPRSS
jgi:hypothetical protein